MLVFVVRSYKVISTKTLNIKTQVHLKMHSAVDTKKNPLRHSGENLSLEMSLMNCDPDYLVTVTIAQYSESFWCS